MLRTLSVCLLSLTALVLSLSTASAVTVYDFATDYSTSINTNTSTWSYRSGTTHNGSYTLLNLPPGTGPGFGGTWSPGPSATVSQGWNLSPTTSLNIVPYVGKNLTGVTQTFGSPTLIWAPNKTMVHADAGELVVISWLSPANGTIDIASRVADAHIVGAANSGAVYFIDRNAGVGPDGLATGLVADGGDSGPLSLTGIGVSAGDRINFVVGLQNVLNSNGTFLDATITFEATPPAPEPSSLLLASLGIVVCGAVRRRKRSSKINR